MFLAAARYFAPGSAETPPPVEDSEHTTPMQVAPKESETSRPRTRRSARKRERADGLYVHPKLPLNVENAGLQRMVDAKSVTFVVDEAHGVLSVHTRTHEAHEYPLLDSTVELALLMRESGVRDVLTMAALHPAHYWNAVRLCRRDLERVEAEILQ